MPSKRAAPSAAAGGIARSPRRAAIPRISPSKLRVYVECPRQFFYQYVARYPRWTRSAYSFGSSLHGALDEFHRQGGVSTQPAVELIGQLDISWVDAAYASAVENDQKREDGQGLLLRYYQAERERHAEVGRPETLFTEKPLSLRRDGYVLTGRLDRLDQRADGVLEVVDYKSGGHLPEQAELENDLAIAVYQLLTARTFDRAPVIGTLYNLRLNQSVSITRSSEQLNEVERQIDRIVLDMTGDRSYQPLPGPRCRWCDFKAYCDEAEL